MDIQSEKRVWRLALDAGHGGQDYGATNKGLEIYEKDINLGVAKIFRNAAYMADLSFDVFMTRRDDSFVSLWKRCDFSRFWRTHAFMSIHTNAREKRGVYGLELEVFHAPGSKLGREFANLALGNLLCDVKKKTNVISRGVKEASFYVLRNTHCPAILVELGFISDFEEARFLIEKKNQRIMALALLNSALLFFESGGASKT